MKKILRHIVSRTYKPFLERYLSKTRVYRYRGIQLEIPAGIFHPGFFFSTRILLKYLDQMAMENKRVLELGCGSGLISIAAAKKGALVTATDINPVAIASLNKNMDRNLVSIQVIESNLFENIPAQAFDIIAINPPYYKKKPVTIKDHAWFYGEKGEYFSGLFGSLKRFVHSNTETLMVLFEDIDMKMIRDMALQNNFTLTCIQVKRNLLEKNFIYKIEPVT